MLQVSSLDILILEYLTSEQSQCGVDKKNVSFLYSKIIIFNIFYIQSKYVCIEHCVYLTLSDSSISLQGCAKQKVLPYL